MTTPLVSVVVTTYRHAHFIADALASVLAQRTSFGLEILVGEDGSDDGTAEIVERIAREHPRRVTVFHRDRRDVVMHAGRPTGRHNFVATLGAARGTYVALLDGDDRWTSPDKLQRQVEHLEHDPRAALCFHRVALVDAADRRCGAVAPHHARAHYDVADLIAWLEIPTSSVLLRRAHVPALGAWYEALPFGDWPFFLLCALAAARTAPLAYLDDELGVYRQHGGGRWSPLSARTRLTQHVAAARAMRERVPPDVRALLDARIALLQGRALRERLHARDPTGIGAVLGRIVHDALSDRRSLLRWVRTVGLAALRRARDDESRDRMDYGAGPSPARAASSMAASEPMTR